MIEIVRPIPGPVDGYGRPTVTGTERFPCPGAFVAPRTSSDTAEPARAGVVVGLTLFVPFGFDVAPGDRVDVDGTEYEVEGVPADWQHPGSGWEAGTTVALRRVAG